MFGHGTESSEALPYEFNSSRNGTKSWTASSGFIEEPFDEIVWWLSVLYKWYIVRKIFYDNLKTFQHRAKYRLYGLETRKKKHSKIKIFLHMTVIGDFILFTDKYACIYLVYFFLTELHL